MQLVIIIFFSFETASHYVMETIRELAILCLSLWCASVMGICHQVWLYKIFIINFPMLPYSTFCCWVHYDLLAHKCSVPVVQDDFLSWFLLFWFTSPPTHEVSWEQLWNKLITMEFLSHGLFLGEANLELWVLTALFTFFCLCIPSTLLSMQMNT